MKRILFLIPLALLALGAFAQTGENREGRPFEPPAAITVSGTLEAVNGRIAVKSGEEISYVFGIDRLIGFVAGLNEGAQVSLEGYEVPMFRDQEYRALLVSRLSFNGKDYDLSPRFGGFPDRSRVEGPGGSFSGKGRRGMGCFGPEVRGPEVRRTKPSDRRSATRGPRYPGRR
jgi:hypothetical protein